MFGTDLIGTMVDNVNACFRHKDLQKKVVVLTVSGEVSKVLIELGIPIYQLQADHLHKQDTLTEITAKLKAHTTSWDVANASNTKAETL